jgi:hypothetical protein
MGARTVKPAALIWTHLSCPTRSSILTPRGAVLDRKVGALW